MARIELAYKEYELKTIQSQKVAKFLPVMTIKSLLERDSMQYPLLGILPFNKCWIFLGRHLHLRKEREYDISKVLLFLLTEADKAGLAQSRSQNSNVHRRFDSTGPTNMKESDRQKDVRGVSRVTGMDKYIYLYLYG